MDRPFVFHRLHAGGPSFFGGLLGAHGGSPGDGGARPAARPSIVLSRDRRGAGYARGLGGNDHGLLLGRRLHRLVERHLCEGVRALLPGIGAAPSRDDPCRGRREGATIHSGCRSYRDSLGAPSVVGAPGPRADPLRGARPKGAGDEGTSGAGRTCVRLRGRPVARPALAGAARGGAGAGKPRHDPRVAAVCRRRPIPRHSRHLGARVLPRSQFPSLLVAGTPGRRARLRRGRGRVGRALQRPAPGMDRPLARSLCRRGHPFQDGGPA